MAAPTRTAEQVRAYLEHFQARVLYDAWAEATAAYWLRRAEAFEAAKPRPGEFHGQQTPEQLSARWQRLDRTAQACRNRAALAENTTLDLVPALRDWDDWSPDPELEAKWRDLDAPAAAADPELDSRESAA